MAITKIKLLPRSTLQAKVRTGFAGSVAAGSGISVAHAANVYTVSTVGHVSGPPVIATDGGTGITSYTVGDMLYASSTTALAKLAAGTSGYALMANGANFAPSWQGYTGTGSNAVTQTWQARLRQWVVATDYDTFDNAVAAAIAAVKPLFVPGGAYTSAGNLTLTNSTTIIGEARAVVGVNITHATNPLFNVTGSFVTISGLQIGSTVARTASANGFINVSGGTVKIHNNLFAGAYNCIVATNAANNLAIEDNHIAIIASGVGVRMGTTAAAGATAQTIARNLFSGAGFAAINLTAVGDVTIAFNQIGGASHGLYVDPGNSQAVLSINSIANFYDQALANNITFASAGSGTIARCDFHADKIAGAAINNVSIAPTGTSTVSGVGFYDIQCSSSGNGIAATTDGGGSIAGIVISGGKFAANTTAITLKGVARATISGGAIIGAADGLAANTTGISLLGTTDNVTITGNVITGNGTDYTNTASGSTILVRSNAGIVDAPRTGTGDSIVYATSPTLITPNLGTPSSLTLTNATGLPVATGISGLGAGVATFLATPSSANLVAAVTGETGSGALVFATSPALVTPDLGTPSAATLTNATGLPVSTGISGLGANVATFLGTPSSANLAAAVTGETGSGALVFATSPTLTTPNIGAATGTSLSLNATTSSLTVGALGGSTNISAIVQGSSGNNFGPLVQIGDGTTNHNFGFHSAIIGGTATDFTILAGNSKNIELYVGAGVRWVASATSPFNFAGVGSLHAANATAIPAGGTAGLGLLVSSTSNFGVFFGSGAPSLSAAKGSLYLRSDGGTGTRAYINTDGGTTWTAITTAA